MRYPKELKNRFIGNQLNGTNKRTPPTTRTIKEVDHSEPTPKKETIKKISSKKNNAKKKTVNKKPVVRRPTLRSITPPNLTYGNIYANPTDGELWAAALVQRMWWDDVTCELYVDFIPCETSVRRKNILMFRTHATMTISMNAFRFVKTFYRSLGHSISWRCKFPKQTNTYTITPTPESSNSPWLQC